MMSEIASIESPDLVTSLPGWGKVDNVQFAGYANIDKNEQLFYWFVGRPNDWDKAPTILWTNGGPGSSSFWGFFKENGPYVIESALGDNPLLTSRPHSWHLKANYLIFEHPLSVSLSFAKNSSNIPSSPQEGVNQLYTALQAFVRLHPQLASNPLLLAGESYAGTYLPLLAEAILDGNKVAGNTVIDLRSTSIGNGWVDPFTQLQSVTKYSYYHGLITEEQKVALDTEYSGDKIVHVQKAIENISGVYMANPAQVGDPPFDSVLLYLNRPDVRVALHACPASKPIVDSSSETVAHNYQKYLYESVLPTVQNLLNRGHTVQVFSGMNSAKDCNFVGTYAWLDKLEGEAARCYKAATPVQWRDDRNVVIGFNQDGGCLSMLRVLNAGHMSPMDQPLLVDKVLQVGLARACHVQTGQAGPAINPPDSVWHR